MQKGTIVEPNNLNSMGSFSIWGKLEDYLFHKTKGLLIERYCLRFGGGFWFVLFTRDQRCEGY